MALLIYGRFSVAKTIPDHVYDSLPEWLTLREAGKALGVSHCTIHNGLHRYKLPMERRACRGTAPAIFFHKETFRELIRMRNRAAVEKTFTYDDSEEGLRHYHGIDHRHIGDGEWECILMRDKYLRKPITPESRMARIFQIVERIRDKQECAA